MLLSIVLHRTSTAPLTSCLRLDEVQITFLDEWLVYFAMFEEEMRREVCFNSVIAQETGTLDRFCHVYHMEPIWFQMIFNFQPDSSFSVILECSSLRASESD